MHVVLLYIFQYFFSNYPLKHLVAKNILCFRSSDLQLGGLLEKGIDS